MIERRIFMKGAAMMAATSLCEPAVARVPDAWPLKPTKLVVPFPFGGSSDVLARLLARQLEAALGQRMLVENWPGDVGMAAARAVAVTNDQNTFMMGHVGTLVFNPLLRGAGVDDVLQGLMPVAMMASVPSLLVVNAKGPCENIADLVTLASRKRGGLAYGSAGVGSAGHAMAASVAHAAAMEARHICYDGEALAVNDLLSGHIDFMMAGGPAVLPLIACDKIRGLAIAKARRSALLPQLPTLIEAGIPGITTAPWYGLMAPVSIGLQIARRMNCETNNVLLSAEARQALRREGAIVASTSAEQFGEFIRSQAAQWRTLVHRASGGGES